MVSAMVLLELGLRGLPAEFRRQAYAVAAGGAVTVLYSNILPIHNDGPLAPRLIPAGAALAAYAMAARARKEESGRVRDLASIAGTVFLCAALWALLRPAVLAPAWALLALALLYAGLALESLLVSLAELCAGGAGLRAMLGHQLRGRRRPGAGGRRRHRVLLWGTVS